VLIAILAGVFYFDLATSYYIAGLKKFRLAQFETWRLKALCLVGGAFFDFVCHCDCLVFTRCP